MSDRGSRARRWEDPNDPGRRRAIGLLAVSGIATAVPLPGQSLALAADPAKQRPQAGDSLVHAAGARKGEPVVVADLAAGDAVGAWARDSASGTVRSGSRLNRVLLMRIDPASADAKTKPRMAEDGIVAYSAFCTHAGCAIESFKPEEQVIVCHCHSSVFDPRANGKVVSGPAKRSLAGLPVRIEGDRLMVAGEFDGKVGVPKPGA